jgi:hypothetical protein
MTLEKQTTPRTGWNKRETFRLVRMLSFLVLVIIAIRWSGKPEHWHWIAPPEPQGSADNQQTATETAEISNPEIRVASGPGGTDANSRDQVEKRTDSSNGDSAVSSVDMPVTPFTPALLETIEDNSLGVRNAEAEAFYAMLAQSRNRMSQEQLTPAGDDVSYTVLMANASHYRGELVTITGDVRRLIEIPVEWNESGIDRLHEAWIFTADSGNNPYRVITTSVPDEMSRGENIHERARVTGYFFKLQGYAALKGLHTAPLILTNRLQRLALPADPKRPGSRWNLLLTAGLIVVALSLGVLRWRIRFGGGGQSQKHPRRFREPLPEKMEIPAEIPPVETTQKILVSGKDQTAATENTHAADS